MENGWDCEVRTGGTRTFRKLHAKALQLQVLRGDGQLV